MVAAFAQNVENTYSHVQFVNKLSVGHVRGAHCVVMVSVINFSRYLHRQFNRLIRSFSPISGGHVDHMMQWFQTQEVCPTGCGCVCKPGRI